MFESKWLQFGMLLIILAIPYAVQAQMIPEDPNHRRDLVDVSMEVDVTFDESSAEYTYVYQIHNSANSPQGVATFALQLSGGYSNPKAPKGWAISFTNNNLKLVWIALIPPGGINNEQWMASVLIQPGETLGGFSFQSSMDLEAVRFFVQGYKQFPENFDWRNLSQDQRRALIFPHNSKTGTVTGPG